MTNSKTGEWKAVTGKTYYSKDAKTKGDAYLQEAVNEIFLSRPN